MPADLLAAVSSGDREWALEILTSTPEVVNAVEKNGQAALHLAVARRDVEMVRLLLQFGANPRAGAGRPWEARSPLAMARSRGYSEIEALFEQEPQAEERTEDELVERVKSAVRSGDLEYLHAHAAQFKAPADQEGWLLRLAVDARRPEVLTLLLDLGFDPDGRVKVDGEDGDTWGMPLYACVRARAHRMAGMLLNRGADPNGRVYASGTPLSEAYGQIDEEMIELLIRFGGKPNPSMAGLYRRMDLALEMLAEHGDASLPDDGFGAGPVPEQLVSAAARGGAADVMRLAIDRVTIPLGDRRWHGLLRSPLGFWNHWYGPWCHQDWDRGTYLECFRMALARSGPPVERYENGQTILHAIASMGDHVRDSEVVDFAAAALDAGATLDARDEMLKSTPLGWAARWGRLPLVQLLLDRGADAAENGAEPWARPLAWAETRGHSEVAALLTDRTLPPQ